MSNKIQRRKSARIEVESLESRRLLAAFGTPWQNARDLSVSFPSDDVQVGNVSNDINATLDQVAAREEWQELALRAYQTWSIHTNINVALQADHNLNFGTPGKLVDDPRFGEFRIGAFPQEGLLASSLPFQTVGGTYSGDVLLNSNEQWTFHDWANNEAPDPATLGPDDRDLFSLLLHETGNTLGIDDNDLDWSVMFRQYTSPKGVLSQEDIDAVVQLYGQRTDPYELAPNDVLANASLISTPANFDTTAEVIRTRGSLQSGADVDIYQIVPHAGQDEVTVRVNAQGVSLLMSRIEILDAAGQVLATDTSDSVFANDNSVHVTGLPDHDAIYIRISALDADDVYAAGDYFVEVDYRNLAVQATDPVPAAYDAGQESLFANFDLHDLEENQNDTLADAIVLDSSIGDNYFQTDSSVSSVTDVDIFQITAPADDSTRLLVSVAGVGAEQPGLQVHVLDADGNGVGAHGAMRSDGTWTLQINQPVAGAEYFVRISVDPASDVGAGNYVATALFEQPSDQMNELVQSEVDSSVDDFVQWTAQKSKLYRFDLSTVSESAAVAVKLTIYDAHTRVAKMTMVVRDGGVRSTLLWLQQGDYILRFTAMAPADAEANAIQYTLLADGISDDQDDDGYEDDANEHTSYEYTELDQSGYYYELPGSQIYDPYAYLDQSGNYYYYYGYYEYTCNDGC